MYQLCYSDRCCAVAKLFLDDSSHMRGGGMWWAVSQAQLKQKLLQRTLALQSFSIFLVESWMDKCRENPRVVRPYS
eukprot:2007634-Amphidinium_carterae.1